MDNRIKDIDKQQKVLEKEKQQIILDIAREAEKLNPKDTQEGHIPLLLNKSKEILEKLDEKQKDIEHIHSLEEEKTELTSRIQENQKQIANIERKISPHYETIGKLAYTKSQEEADLIPSSQIKEIEEILADIDEEKSEGRDGKENNLISFGRELFKKGKVSLKESQLTAKYKKLGQSILSMKAWEQLDMEPELKDSITELIRNRSELDTANKEAQSTLDNHKQELKDLKEAQILKDIDSLKKVLFNHRILLGREFLDTIAGMTNDEGLQELLSKLNKNEENSNLLKLEAEEIERNEKISDLSEEIQKLSSDIKSLEDNIQKKKAKQQALEEEKQNLEKEGEGK
ncbi:hypothetical protein [Spirochaeta cellobiosiphila]|uniref:hypothetical protein n=1 Tax=Spirochaeta cellobiosiphila TaxID=504483 RepID=UPI0003FEC156|nr:hypothetical protein [Spirochaeta cellobiosiphila]